MSATPNYSQCLDFRNFEAHATVFHLVLGVNLSVLKPERRKMMAKPVGCMEDEPYVSSNDEAVFVVGEQGTSRHER